MSTAFKLGALVVAAHDRDGYPFELALLTARDMGLRPSLFGMLCECVNRHW